MIDVTPLQIIDFTGKALNLMTAHLANDIQAPQLSISFKSMNSGYPLTGVCLKINGTKINETYFDFQHNTLTDPETVRQWFESFRIIDLTAECDIQFMTRQS